MRILITGVGDAFTRRHFSTGALIEGPEGHVLIDCGDLIHRSLAEACRSSGWSVDVLQISDILLTHLHGDHANGLESFGFLRRYASAAEGLPAPRLHTHPKAAERVWQKLAPAMDGGGKNSLETYFDLYVLEMHKANHVAGLEVRVRMTGHPIPTVGLLISDGQSTLGWSGDTPFERAHIDWLNQADLIVHESNLGAAHTPIEDLNGLPDEIRRKIRLIHLPDGFNPACTDMKPLVQGQVLEL